MDDYFESLLEDREPLMTIGGNHVLVEFSWVGLPAGFRSVFFNMKMAGYEPVLAHPERYHYLHKDFDVYRRFMQRESSCKRTCCRLQGITEAGCRRRRCNWRKKDCWILRVRTCITSGIYRR